MLSSNDVAVAGGYRTANSSSGSDPEQWSAGLNLGFSGFTVGGSFAIEDSQFKPKPNLSSYEAFNHLYGIDPGQAVFFEDLARNLAPAHAMGYATVLVQSDKDWSHEPAAARPAGLGDDLPPHIDYVTRDLTEFLRTINA